MEENFIYNYLALAGCILAPSMPNTSKIISIITGQDVSDSKLNMSKRQKVVILDTWEGTKVICASHKEAGLHTSISSSAVGIYVRSGKLYKGRYYFLNKT